MSTYDLVCIGAGPTGLATAIEAKRAGMHPLVIDKACLCNSIYHYPVNMVFFTTPELLEIGDLPLVSATEKPTRVEALKYYRKASAVEAALDLYRNGARVTLVHRGKELGATIKYWVRPDIENRIKAGQIRAFLNTRVEEITKDEVVVENHAQTKRIAAKQVFALTGYHPDYSFMEAMGVKLDPESKRPALDPNTLESNVPGIHLAGVVIGGRHTGEIFIENGRFHGKQIVEALKK